MSKCSTMARHETIEEVENSEGVHSNAEGKP
jgi:hypothetical protein